MSVMLAYASLVFGLAQSALYLGAVLYAYRLTRLTGAFYAWMLLITALILLASHSISNLVQIAIQVPFGSLITSTDGVDATTFLLSNLSDLLLSALLFSAMYGLHGRFKQLSK